MSSECHQSVFRVSSECHQSVIRVSSECLQSVFRVCSILKSFHHLAHLVCQFLAFFLLENMVSPEKTLTDGQENQKRNGGQQSEGEGERAGEDLGETRPLIQISDGVLTLKTFAVLIVIFF